MKQFISLIIFIVCIFCLAGTGHALDQPARSDVETTVVGRVLPMPEILALKKVKADSEPLEKQVALLGDDGRAWPILSDEGGRLFFLDKQMLHRRARLKLKTTSDMPFAQVISVEIEHEGKWRVPQYYCDVCTIAVRYPQICLCCQGPMEFRLKPER